MSDITREDRIASIHQLADWLEAHPEVPLPYELGGASGTGNLLIFTHDLDDPKAVIADVARALPGKVTKDTYGEGSGAQLKLVGSVGHINIEAIANRDLVCERVVTGIREVTEDVPDPEKLAEVPTISVTTTVEDIEWRCAPVLAQDKVLAEVAS